MDIVYLWVGKAVVWGGAWLLLGFLLLFFLVFLGDLVGEWITDEGPIWAIFSSMGDSWTTVPVALVLMPVLFLPGICLAMLAYIPKSLRMRRHKRKLAEIDAEAEKRKSESGVPAA